MARSSRKIVFSHVVRRDFAYLLERIFGGFDGGGWARKQTSYAPAPNAVKGFEVVSNAGHSSW